jgi:hypothetical protein
MVLIITIPKPQITLKTTSHVNDVICFHISYSCIQPRNLQKPIIFQIPFPSPLPGRGEQGDSLLYPRSFRTSLLCTCQARRRAKPVASPFPPSNPILISHLPTDFSTMYDLAVKSLSVCLSIKSKEEPKSTTPHLHLHLHLHPPPHLIKNSEPTRHMYISCMPSNRSETTAGGIMR